MSKKKQTKKNGIVTLTHMSHRKLSIRVALFVELSKTKSPPPIPPSPSPLLPAVVFKLCGLIMCAFLTPLISKYDMFTLGKQHSKTAQNTLSGYISLSLL